MKRYGTIIMASNGCFGIKKDGKYILYKDYETLKAENTRQKAVIDKLKKYGKHNEDCIKCRHSSADNGYWIDDKRECDCGLDKALQEAEG